MRLVTLPSSTLIPHLGDVIDGELYFEPWDCDIRSINADLIQDHNRALIADGGVAEPGFENYNPNPKPLADLIADDIRHILNPLPGLFSESREVLILEAWSQDVNAQVLLRPSGGDVIAFHTPTVAYLNSFCTRMQILLSFDTYAGCLPEHRTAMEAPDYEDLPLIISIFNDAEIFVNATYQRQPPSPRYLGDPYDFCQIVEGARRFMVAHELAHLLADEWRAHDDGFAKLRNAFQNEAFGFTDIQRENWVTEHWCDEFAIRTFNQLYLHSAEDPVQMHEATNAICGVLTFFWMLDFLETGLNTHNNFDRHFPPAHSRFHYVREIIKQLRFYMNDHTKRIVGSLYERLCGARRVFGGQGFDPKRGSMAFLLPVHLSDFGRGLARNIFEGMVAETFRGRPGAWIPGEF